MPDEVTPEKYITDKVILDEIFLRKYYPTGDSPKEANYIIRERFSHKRLTQNPFPSRNYLTRGCFSIRSSNWRSFHSESGTLQYMRGVAAKLPVRCHHNCM